MASAQRSTKPPDIVRDLPSGAGGGDHRPEERSSSSVVARRPRSRAVRKTTSREGRKQPLEYRSAGELLKLLDMPLDILYEIFSLVRPVDLLRISWAGKTFRSVLTNRSSRQVWVAAFDNIHEALQPPPCPEDLTEIAYANLLYNARCMGCGELRGRAYWAAHVRVCVHCIKDWVAVRGGAQDCAIIVLSRGHLLSSNQVLSTVSTKILPLPNQIHMFTKDLERLAADLEASDDRAAVVQQYKDRFAVRSKFACELERLDKIGVVGRGAVHTAARERRIDQIVERLADDGWREEIISHRQEYLRCIGRMEGACVARPLVGKVWGKMRGLAHQVMCQCKRRMGDKALEARRTRRGR